MRECELRRASAECSEAAKPVASIPHECSRASAFRVRVLVSEQSRILCGLLWSVCIVHIARDRHVTVSGGWPLGSASAARGSARKRADMAASEVRVSECV